jgi:hypothetical protein
LAVLLAWVPILLTSCGDSGPASTSAAVIELGPVLDSVVGVDQPEVAYETAPGVLLLPDPQLPGLIHLEFATGRRDTIGRAGDGPGEYRAPSFVFALPAGRIGVVDGVARRVTVLAPALTFEEHRAIPAGLSPFLLRADTLGNQFGVGPGAPQAAPGDSAPVVRLRAAATAVDTVGFVERLQTAPIQIGQMGVMVPAEYAPRDLWGVDMDGTVWIARGSRRAVDVIGPDGTRATFPLPFAPIPTVDADRALFRGLPAPEGLDRAARELAPIKGPFQEVRTDLSGRYFLWLNQPAGYTTEQYAEFDRSGAHLRTVVLPQSWKIIAVSAAAIYAAREAESGEWVVRRYERPR